MVPSLIFAIEGSTSNKVEKCGKKYATRHKPTFFCSSQVKEKTNMADPGEAQIKSKVFFCIYKYWQSKQLFRASNWISSEKFVRFQDNFHFWWKYSVPVVLLMYFCWKDYITLLLKCQELEEGGGWGGGWWAVSVIKY